MGLQREQYQMHLILLMQGWALALIASNSTKSTAFDTNQSTGLQQYTGYWPSQNDLDGFA